MEESALRVTRLSPADRKKLDRTHPEFRDRAALVVSGSPRLMSALEGVIREIAREEEQSERLLEILTEWVGSRVPDESRVLQLQRQAEARDLFLREFTTLTSQDVAALSGSTARNTAALASRWKSDGKIFALSAGRVDRFPAFQFGEDGKPLPIIARIIEIFQDRNPWALALWFASNSGWLGGRRPVDLLRERPDDVVEAACRAVAPLAL